jgi:PAS domain S-box-containing protein
MPKPDQSTRERQPSSDRVASSWRQEAIISLAVFVLLTAFLFRFIIFKRILQGTSSDILLELLSFFFVLALILCLLTLYRWEILRQDYVSQQQLHERLRLLQEAVETMEIGLTITDVSGRILYVNQADARMHGYKPEQLIGQEARIFAPKELWRPMSQNEISQATRLPREKINIRADGSTFPVHLISNVVRSQNGEPIGFVTSCEDISERVRVEEEIQESQQRLRKLAQHLDVVAERERGRVAREIYHDIGTPLTMLKLELSMIEKHLADQSSSQVERVHKMLEHIDTTIDIVRKIAHQLGSSSLLEQVGLIGTIEASVDQIKKKSPVQLILDLPEEELSWNDEVKTALFRVWRELVANALRHASPLTVHTTLKTVPRLPPDEGNSEATTNQARKGGHTIFLQVKDDGIGIAEKDIFGETGFGLHTLRERVNLINGKVEINGSPGKGTVVTIRAPVIEVQS